MLKDPLKKDLPLLPKRTVIIKRYQNRKLYDTQNSTYVTLEDIGAIIRRGDDVKVVDNKTKEDLTSVTLTQIIFEEEKKNKNSLPLNALKKIIRGGGDAILDLVSKTSDNVQSTLHQVKEGAETIYDKLREELAPNDDNIIKEVFNKTQNITKNIEDKFKSTVGSIAHVGSLQAEIRKLRQRILFLEKKLKVYEQK
jgi:polyhydroxyalkanoate synthesis repressor PhaR